jgi:ferredoxin/flavodoxin---NADP+ reductase
MENCGEMQIAIIGAGPAGLFASEALAAKGFGVALFNRDIKPGGLAEYGIFPDKYKLKNGLRNQFSSILASERISYFGNVHIGTSKGIDLHTLFEWGFSAVLITCGAQGKKSLNLPGENLAGVYHAKDLVYHYNKLPPYADREFKFGKKAAIVGAGNVMADICHFLTKYTAVEEITAVIRRGPGEVKFDRKELLSFISYLDLSDFDKEIERVSTDMEKIGQDIKSIKENILIDLSKACPKEREASIQFRFLASPKQIIGNDENKATAMEYEENYLLLNEGEVAARGTGKTNTIEIDNVIFAIGDRVQDELGLPICRNEFCKSTHPRYPVDGESYEIEDPATGEALTGIFVAGWSRNPSSGLVGTARKDGVHAVEAVTQFLSEKTELTGIAPDECRMKLDQLSCRVVSKSHLAILHSEEMKQAAERGVEEYKFSTSEEMLKIMGLG